MLNYIWLALVVLSVLIGGWTGKLDNVTRMGFEMAETAVMKIALPLSAIMTIWLGVMRLAEKSGLVFVLARFLRPVLGRLFPDVPVDHPAMGAMVMNLTANMLGLANAATPLGLRAMADLQKLNPFPGTATNAMCTFLAINTSSIQLIPATAVGILAVAGSANPTSIVGTALMATLCSTAVGITAVKILEKLPMYRISRAQEPGEDAGPAPAPVPAAEPDDVTLEQPAALPEITRLGKSILILFLLFFVYLLAAIVFPELRGTTVTPERADQNMFTRVVQSVSVLAIPFFLSFFPLYAALRRIKVYEEFVEGAKEGFQVAIRVIPYLVTILAAVGMFRGAGGIAMLSDLLSPVLSRIGFPTELLPLVLMRPLSGSGSIALFSDLVKEHGPNDILSLMGATILGSTETTFYVIAVYFGAVGIRRTRHAVPAGLLADLAGVIASIAICRLVL